MTIYQQGVENTNTCPEGTTRIESAEECNKATKQFKGKRMEVLDPPRAHDPIGCFAAFSGEFSGFFFFNPHSTGKRNNERTPICKQG